MLTLHIEAENYPELVAKAAAAIDAGVRFGNGSTKTAEAVLEAVNTPPAAGNVVLPAPVEKPAKRAKKTTDSPPPADSSLSAGVSAPAAAPAAAPQGAATAQPAGALSSAVPSVDDVRAALGKVNEVLGMAICTAMLGEVGAERVSLVPEAKRAEIIAACNAKVAKHAADAATKTATKPAPGA